MSARVLAPCKINPTLVVIGRREDGFHELDLTFLALDLCDLVELEPAAEGAGTIRIEGPMATQDIPVDARNSARGATLAALEIARREGRIGARADFDLRLTKHIPSQAGLGGGSSDAAAAALGVCGATGLNTANPGVSSALARLGSDTTFFFAARGSGHARGRGRGEQIEVLPACASKLYVALIAPRFGTRTEQVYRALEAKSDPALDRARGEDRFRAWLHAKSIDELRSALCNDLEAAAVRAYPPLAQWRALLDRSGAAHFRLAGSGSTFYGIYSEEGEARFDLEKLTRAALSRGLDSRGGWVTRPAQYGARMTS